VNTPLTPQSRPRRSFVYRKLANLGARYVECNEAATAASFGGTEETAAARNLGLADLSPLRRVGFKGPGAADWLLSQGVSVPEINRCTAQADGAKLFRLGANDLMITTDLGAIATLPEKLAGAWTALENPPQSPRGFPMPRQEGFCWFVLTGRHAAAAMAKICGVDLRPHKFPAGAIAQTSVARLSAVVARDDINGTLAYHLFADSASAEYWWDCLLDAMQEFGGRPVGIDALRAL
jgi:sarcosine oxidase subunit gamma